MMLRQSDRKRTRRNAFTLMEVLVVVAIIVVLTGIGIGVFAYLDSSKEKIAKADAELANYHTWYLDTPVYSHLTYALLALVPTGELGAIQGVMQAVSRGATAAGVSWLVAPTTTTCSPPCRSSTTANWSAGRCAAATRATRGH